MRERAGWHMPAFCHLVLWCLEIGQSQLPDSNRSRRESQRSGIPVDSLAQRRIGDLWRFPFLIRVVKVAKGYHLLFPDPLGKWICLLRGSVLFLVGFNGRPKGTSLRLLSFFFFWKTYSYGPPAADFLFAEFIFETGPFKGINEKGKTSPSGFRPFNLPCLVPVHLRSQLVITSRSSSALSHPIFGWEGSEPY